MTFIKQQAKGSATRTIIDFEEGFGVPLQSPRRPILIPFNTNELSGTRNQTQPATIRGDRNPTEPIQGNKDVMGNLSVPLDTNGSGYLMSALFGRYVRRTEIPQPNAMVGTPTLNLSSGTGIFSVPQTGAAVGDRVVWSDDSGQQFSGYLTAKSDDSEWTISLARDGSGTPADITAATVDGIAANLAESSPGTVDIANGIATFSATHAALANNQVLFYDGTKVARIVRKLTATTAEVQDMEGMPAGNETGVDVEAITAPPFIDYEWWIHPTAALPSMMIEKGMRDLRAPYFERFNGCKFDTFELAIGGDGELLATIGVVGAQSAGSYTPHDATSKLSGVSPTVSIVGSTRVATFSDAQVGIAVGDVVVYKSATADITGGRVVARSSDSVVTLDAVPGDETAVELIAVYSPVQNVVVPTATRIQQFDATAYVDGVEVNMLANWTLRIGQALDRDSFVIGGKGVRADLAEGIADVGGTLTALFRDATLVDAAKSNQKLALRCRFTTTQNEFLEFDFQEVKLQEKSPAISGPAGMRYDPNYQAYKNESVSAAIVRLRTHWLDYTLPASAGFSII
jgi:hypothetical protein